MDVLLACGTGPQAGARAHLQELWPRLTGLRWLHSLFAGLEHLMFPELAASEVVMTNAKVTDVLACHERADTRPAVLLALSPVFFSALCSWDGFAEAQKCCCTHVHGP